MDNSLQGRRITFKRKVPNPIFLGWLEELLEEAKAKKSKLETMLEVALNSMRHYPLPLLTGSECCILKGFDKRLCMFLDKRLEVYNSNNQECSDCSESASESVSGRSSHSNGSQSCLQEQRNNNEMRVGSSSSSRSNSTNQSAKRKNRRYKPVFRSGSYAILLALLEHQKNNPQNLFIKKDDLITIAQKYSEESFVRPKPESFYTAWSNMKTLINKSLVQQRRNKFMQYSLTDEGVTLAEELLKDTENQPTMDDIIFNGASSSSIQSSDSNSQCSTNSVTRSDSVITVSTESTVSVTVPSRSQSNISYVNFEAGTFDIILLIDKNETGGVTKKNDPTVAQFNKYPSLKHEYRNLKVGDFTWIARHKVNTNEELVLPYIIERKRMDDLGKSVKDGRFHEQKFRLRKCGIKHVFYLVENFGSNKHVGLPVQSLKQALANTKVHDGFKVYMTDSLTDTARCLAMLTKRLTIEYENMSLLGCNKEPEGDALMTFNFFNKSSSKNKPLTVTETFIKLLLQLKGVSVEKALTITKVYKTPKSLLQEYEKCNEKEGQFLLANLKYGASNRNVGPSVSKAVYELFS